MKPYLWWWALLLAVLVFAARFGVTGTARTVLEIGAVVLFFVLWFVGGIIRAMFLAVKERRERGE